MTPINSFRDLTVSQVSMDFADVCFDIVEAIHIRIDSRSPISCSPYSLGSHGEVDTLFELIGKMLHGLTESLEIRLNAQNA